ncbi:hypothetical protein [Leuconostoc lactis]|uniref:hypothetical protein n=1 Tax=Leuconostoc lactis TaxID=1246 RepID=UPI0010210F0E|nr:hypothetical protein [Leuconostoc lactis]MSB65611.1 hypothetical protein [Leuconostoc lactis]RYS84922.1 hypothetical protein EAI73_08260 [Leuconostoc lactis]
MTITQLTLLDDQSFREIRRSKYVVILVQELRNNIVERKKKKAVVCLNAYDMKIKNELFDDCLGNRYVGCTLLKGSHYSSTDAQIPVFKIKLNIEDYLAKKLVPIIDELDQKRRNYYAN